MMSMTCEGKYSNSPVVHDETWFVFEDIGWDVDVNSNHDVDEDVNFNFNQDIDWDSVVDWDVVVDFNRDVNGDVGVDEVAVEIIAKGAEDLAEAVGYLTIDLVDWFDDKDVIFEVKLDAVNVKADVNKVFDVNTAKDATDLAEDTIVDLTDEIKLIMEKAGIMFDVFEAFDAIKVFDKAGNAINTFGWSVDDFEAINFIETDIVEAVAGPNIETIIFSIFADGMANVAAIFVANMVALGRTVSVKIWDRDEDGMEIDFNVDINTKMVAVTILNFVAENEGDNIVADWSDYNQSSDSSSSPSDEWVQ